MLFRNLTLFRFPLSLRPALETLADKLPDHALKSLGPLELSTRGFVSPLGRGHEALSHRISGCLLINLGREEKILPSSVVNDALATKIDRIREKEDRSPGAKERKRLKDEVLLDLLPRAFAKSSQTAAYLDLDTGWLLIDTASRKLAEAVVSAIREVLGSFPALPVNAESSPRALMTSWLAGEDLPDGISLGDECELRDPVDGGAIAKLRHQEMNAVEVAEHLQSGKQCFQLGLNYQDRLTFVIGDDLVIRKLKFLETATEPQESDTPQSLEAELDASFAIMTGELGLLLHSLSEALSLSESY